MAPYCWTKRTPAPSLPSILGSAEGIHKCTPWWVAKVREGADGGRLTKCRANVCREIPGPEAKWEPEHLRGHFSDQGSLENCLAETTPTSLQVAVGTQKDQGLNQPYLTSQQLVCGGGGVQYRHATAPSPILQTNEKATQFPSPMLPGYKSNIPLACMYL